MKTYLGILRTIYLNKLIKTVQLLSYQTLFIKICVNNDPTGLLPQLVGNFFNIFLFVVFCKLKINVINTKHNLKILIFKILLVLLKFKHNHKLLN